MVLLILVMSLLVPVNVQATTYYVDTTGNNSNDGLSESTPKRTLTHCVSIMVAGDTCYVRGGTYSTETTIRFSTSGSSGSPITLAAYPNESPIVDWVDQAIGDSILIQHSSGQNVAMGYIVIEGLELKNGYDGIKFYSLHNSIIQHNWIHDNVNQGILGAGGHHNLFTRNRVNHNGNFAECIASGYDSASCSQKHGMYLHGDSYTITNNLIYDNMAFGLQQNGSSSSSYSSTRHPSTEFAGAANWIVANNTFAYNNYAAGMVVWGGLCDNLRLENNIFYENAVLRATSVTQGVHCTSCSGATGVTIKNNHAYASGSGGLVFQASGFDVGTVVSGNVSNVSAPAFVDGGSGTLPGSPDFRLTASSPVNIALANEFPNNSTNVVGAYKTIADPTASITTNKITLTVPMSTAVPIDNLSTTGVTVGCTGSACPGSPTVSAVSRAVGADSQVEITISGITGNACEATNQTWTVSYNASTGSWTGYDNIGPYPGSHQKLFSFTSLAVTNNCTGSGPASYPAGYYIHYKFDEGTGTSANDESANNLDGTLTNSPTWGSGKTGYGVVMTGNDTKYVAIPYGSGVDPSSQSLTIAFGVNVAAGMESLTRGYFGSALGTNQRFYVSTSGGTWRIGMQTHAASSAGSIAVTSGWHSVCLTANSATDVATLYIDGVASTTTVSYTSFALASNFELGRIGGVSTGAEGTYDDLLVYQSVADCSAISAAFHADPPAPGGTLAQVAIQFQGVILDTAGSPIVVGASVQTIEVPAGGGVAILFQIHCTNVSDCDPTAYKLMYAVNGSSTWQQVPDVETADGTYMWGAIPEANLNNGTRSTRLTGSCTLTNGATQLTAEQIPAIDLPQDGCTVLAYIIRVGASHAGDYFDYKLRTEADADLAGGYTQTARVRVVNPMASGIGF